MSPSARMNSSSTRHVAPGAGQIDLPDHGKTAIPPGRGGRVPQPIVKTIRDSVESLYISLWRPRLRWIRLAASEPAGVRDTVWQPPKPGLVNELVIRSTRERTCARTTGRWCSFASVLGSSMAFNRIVSGQCAMTKMELTSPRPYAAGPGVIND